MEKRNSGTLDETLILTNNLDDNRHASAFSNFYCNNVLYHTLGETNANWLDQQLENLRASTPLEDYLPALEPIAPNVSQWVLDCP